MNNGSSPSYPHHIYMTLWQRFKNPLSPQARTQVAPMPSPKGTLRVRLGVVFQHSSREGEKLPLRGAVPAWRIGTKPECEILFDMVRDAEVDPQHAEIKWAKEEYWIVPQMPSRVWLNGVLVADQKILQPGDKLTFGLKHGPGLEIVIDQEEKVVAAEGRVLRVHIEKGGTQPQPERRFEKDFTIGRSRQCDIQVNDPLVSSRHAEVVYEQGRWIVQDLQSTNGIYLNGTRVHRAALPPQSRLELARGGPALKLALESPPAPAETLAHPDEVSMTKIAQRYFDTEAPEKAGAHTMLIRRAFHQVRRKQSKRYGIVIGVILVVMLGLAGAWYQQRQRVKELERLHALAEDVFYAMKAQEVQIAQLRSLVGRDQALKKQFDEKLRQQQSRREGYNKIAREALGISPEKISAEDWLIYQVARWFGECDASMPADFVQTVRKYIGYWKSTSRLHEALARAQANGYTVKIVETLKANDLPPHFFYLALKESGFDVKACGPATRYGYAKGMWQFIPPTAKDYGLLVGPWADFQIYDPRDERHDFEKSTAAAAKYLQDLYATKAQASGLLVMACYNWGESNILPLIERLPENPRERNFWRLLAQAKIPQETYDYVFYIFSAAVIGENPRLYGFDFDKPLPPTF